MTFVLGVVLFAAGIGISIALHEAGHMYSAKAFGMKVRRYFIGFGPTLFSFRRGETEYGLKLIPAGGFCDIAGMTGQEELTDPEDRKRAFFRFPTWQRVVVLSAGSLTHFAVGIVLIYVMAVSTGLPNLHPQPTPAVVAAVSPCIAVRADGSCEPGSPAPARDAGLRPGDRVLAVAGTPVSNFDELGKAIQSHAGQPTEFRLQRDGTPLTVQILVARVPISALGGQGDQLVGAIGVAPQRPDAARLHYGPVGAVGQTISFTGAMFANTWQALKQLPNKIPALLDRIHGQYRPDSPVSVVGASVLGGDAVGYGAWWFFLFLLASLNLFVGVFNLLPLLPLDGGHIAVNVYEGVRNAVRRATGRANGPPVDYARLMPLTYAVMLVFIGVTVLTITADIINPLRLHP
ncbi:MAG: M50 family metallopeptidase [Pseudonocardiaceae bacterium]